MTVSALAMVLMAAALVMVPRSAGPRSRLPRSTTAIRASEGSPPAAQARGFLTRIGGGSVVGPGARPAGGGDPLALAGAWDLLGGCVRAGLPVPVAVRAVAEGMDPPAGPVLRRTAELLALGADPDQAWQPALDCVSTARLARAARRSGRSGTALAESLMRLAAAERAQAREQSETRAQRAGVLIAGPLGLCFLPAFLAIGVIPVVLGLAGELVQQW